LERFEDLEMTTGWRWWRWAAACGAGVVALAVVSLPAATNDTANGEWRRYSGDNGSMKYSPLDQINAANFSKLQVAWRFKTDHFGPRPEYKLEGTPLMVKGVLYATAGTRRSDVRPLRSAPAAAAAATAWPPWPRSRQ